jgi:sigma-B regulation protein RsbU (phosphoserine phosphatase)
MFKENSSEHNKKLNQLSTLVELGMLLNSTLNLKEVQKRATEAATIIVGAEAGSLLLIDEKTNELFFDVALGEKGSKVKEVRLKLGEGIAGWVAQHKRPLVIKDAKSDPRFSRKADEKSGFVTNNIICVPVKSREKIIGVLQAINKIGGKYFLEADVRILSSLANQVAIAVENARLYEEIKEKERLEEDLKIAHQIQTAFLPKDMPKLEGFDIFGDCVPAKEVGGDFFDFITLDENRLGFVIADVAGKGVPAALFTTMCKSLIWSISKNSNSPKNVLILLNRLIWGIQQSDMFITLFYAILDKQKKSLRYSNAGHNPPILYHGNAKFEKLKARGKPLGIFEKINLEEHAVAMFPNDIIVFYTDGITDAADSEGKRFGEDRLKAVVSKNGKKSAEDLTRAIFNSQRNFVKEEPQFDDITLVVLKVCQ